MHKKTIIIALFFVLISSAYAKEDFNISAKGPIDICPCSAHSNPVLIINNGDKQSRYMIDVDSAFSDAVKVNPNNFILKPNQGAYTNLNFNFPCNIYGKYSFKVNVATDSGLTKSITQAVNVLPCYNYSVYPGEIHELKEDETSIVFKQFNGTYRVCAGTSNVIPILLKNNAGVGNSYNLKVSGAGFASLNVKGAELKPKQKGVVLINLNPEEGVEGNFKAMFTSTSALGSTEEKLNLDIDVQKCYDIDVEFSKEKDSICGGELAAYPVTVENKGVFDEKLSFSISGADWAWINKTSDALKMNDKNEIEVFASPGYEESGRYTIRFDAFGRYVNKSDELILDVLPKKECYNAVINANNIRTDYSGVIAPISVENMGTKVADYAVNIDAPEWVSVIPDSLRITPGKKGNINLKAMPTADIEEGVYSITINVVKDEITYSKPMDITVKENKALKGFENWLKFYQYYLYLAFVLLAVILVSIRPIKRRIESYNAKRREKARRRAERLKKKGERAEKPDTGNWLKGFLYALFVVLLAAVLVIFKDFLITYLFYIIAGIVILIILISVLKSKKYLK